MLRIIIGVIGLLCLVAGVLLQVLPQHAGIGLIVFGGLVLISLVFEGRYRTAKVNAASWQATGEKFIDPATGKLVEVDYDPNTGERRYRDE